MKQLIALFKSPRTAELLTHWDDSLSGLSDAELLHLHNACEYLRRLDIFSPALEFQLMCKLSDIAIEQAFRLRIGEEP